MTGEHRRDDYPQDEIAKRTKRNRIKEALYWAGLLIVFVGYVVLSVALISRP